MTLTLSRQNLTRWINKAIQNFHTKDLLGVPDPWLKIYESLSSYICDNNEVDDKLLWLIEETDDVLPDIIYLLQRLKNALVQELVKESGYEELPVVLSWFDRAIVLLSEIYSVGTSRERNLSKPLETIFWNARDGMYISTLGGKFVHCNEALVKMLKYPNLDTLLEMDIQNDLYIDKEDRQVMLDHLANDGFFDHHEFGFRRRDGDTRTAHESCYMVNVSEEKKFVVGIMVDVTEEKESQRKTAEYVKTVEKSGIDTLLTLRRTTRRYEALLSLNDHPVCLVDVKDFRILNVNQAFKKRFKSSRKKTDQVTLRDLFSRDEWMKVFSQVSNIAQRHHFHVRNLKVSSCDRSEFTADLSVVVHQDDQGSLLFIQIEDRSQIEKKELLLERGRHNIEGLFDGLPVGVIGFRHDGSMAMTNRYFHELTGYGARQLKNLSFINRLFAQDEWRLKFHRYLRQFIRGRHVRDQPLELRSRSDEVLHFRMSTLTYQFEDQDKPGFLALLTNVTDHVILEKLLQTREKNPGSLDKAYSVMESQIESLEGALELSKRKNRFLHGFTRHITNKFKIPIHLVLGFASLLKLDLGKTARAGQREDVSIIEDHIRFLLNMLEKAAEYADLDSGEVQPVNATQNVRAMIDHLFEQLVPKNLPEGVHFSAERLILSLDLKIICDPTLLGVLLRHIVDNSVAFTEKGTIAVTAYEEQSRLWVELQDTGIGICATDLPQVFEPFFQVPREGDTEQRLGLGLAIARKYADLAGFTLDVESKLNKGTKVLIGIGRFEPEERE